MQPTETDGQILVAIADETYDATDDEEWGPAREKYRRALEVEFGVPFDQANIGAGADFPAFVTLLQTGVQVPAWLLIAGAFFLGKPLNENLEAWQNIAKRVRSFFSRPVYLSRQGAAVIAMEAVLEEMGGLPKSIRLLSYWTQNVMEKEDLAALPSAADIAEAPPTLSLGDTRHIFEIEADAVRFRASVQGKEVKVMRLSE